MTPGDTFGDYAVVRLLGKGGMGEVWLLEGKSGTQVAAKILDPEAGGDHESRKRFLREAQLALGVKHPNLVEVYDVGEDPETGLCYILMEYVPGGSLADYLKANGALAIEDAVAVVEAIAGVLELARQKGIVHRDIKPANIMFDAEGTPKLADLGIARGGSSGVETTTVTQTGTMIGTPAYMAPEQMLDAHNVDTRADIYSLGVVFYEMLTGERPNKDDTVVQLMAKAVKGEPLPDVRALRPEVSASLAQLLAMMVAPDKDGRISTPGQITSALAIIERGGTFAAGGAGARRPTATGGAARAVAPRPADSPSRGFPKWIVPVAVLAALAGAFFALAPKGDRAVRPVVSTNVIERIVERNVVVTNVVEARGAAAWTKRDRVPKFRMEERPEASSWIVAHERDRKPVRICLDLSHGGFPSLTQAFYTKWMKSLPNPAHKACWHDLTTENLDSVNLLILPNSSAQQLYDERECKAIDDFLRAGGTVVSISERKESFMWAMDKFLGRYGLETFLRPSPKEPSGKNRRETRPVGVACPAFEGLQVKSEGTVFAAPSTQEGAQAWTALLTDSLDGRALMAARNVGRGHLVWSSSWSATADTGDFDSVWKRIFLAAGRERPIAASTRIGQRPVTDAPFVKRVGPITFYTSNFWRSNAEAIARIVRDTLPVLERYCDCTLNPGQMSITKIVLTGTGIWGFLPQGEKTIVTGACFRGFPDNPVHFAAFVFRIMVGGSLPFDYKMQLDNYIALRAFCDMGYPRQMDQAIEAGRQKGDVGNRRYRCLDDSVVDESGREVRDNNSTIRKAKYFAVYEEMRKTDPDFFVKLVRKCRRRGGRFSAGRVVGDLSEILGTDAGKMFAAYRIDLASIAPAAGEEGSRVSPICRSLKYDRMWSYRAVDGGIELTACENAKSKAAAAVRPAPVGDMSVPARIGSRPVVSVGRWAFVGCSNLRRLEIPEGVTSIRDWGAFFGCTSLVSVTLPASLKEISACETFARCLSLKEIRFAGDLPRLVDANGREAASRFDSMIFRDAPEDLVVRVPAAAKGWDEKWPAQFRSGRKVLRDQN